MCVLFFKQKTAYEMRISDWSSDVCSSDLRSIRPCTYWSNRRSTSGSKSLALALRLPLMSCLRFVDDANLAGGAERTRYGRGRPACLRSFAPSLRGTPVVQRLASRKRHDRAPSPPHRPPRSEEHTSELQSLMRNSYADFCLQKKTKKYHYNLY